MTDNAGAIAMKALALFSGGLDSILAVKLIESQGHDVVGVFFETPFFTRQKAVRSARSLGLPLIISDITNSLLKIVIDPRHGYGKGINPCIDCHTLMFKKIGEMLKEQRADFIISGEVLGQRPMSQNLRSLTLISHDSGFKDLIIRPLSAKRLPETMPEKKGWITREELLGLSGRSRKPQMELAKKFGIEEYPTPAGGCLLTEAVFSRRLRDLITSELKISRRDIELLKWGRHFRINERAKIVVGRNQKENEIIASLRRQGDTLLTVESFPGPTVLITGDPMRKEIQVAASIAVSYSDVALTQSATVSLTKDSKIHTILARGREKRELHRFMI